MPVIGAGGNRYAGDHREGESKQVFSCRDQRPARRSKHGYLRYLPTLCAAAIDARRWRDCWSLVARVDVEVQPASRRLRRAAIQWTGARRLLRSANMTAPGRRRRSPRWCRFGRAGPRPSPNIGTCPAAIRESGGFGDCSPPAPPATLIVCLLMVTAASLPPMLPNISLAWPGFGMMSAFAATSGYFCARLTDGLVLLRPSFSIAGPSGEVNASCTRSAFTTARVGQFLPAAFAEFATIEGEHGTRVRAGMLASSCLRNRASLPGSFPLADVLIALCCFGTGKGASGSGSASRTCTAAALAAAAPGARARLPRLGLAVLANRHRPDPEAMTLTFGPICMTVNELTWHPWKTPSRPFRRVDDRRPFLPALRLHRATVERREALTARDRIRMQACRCRRRTPPLRRSPAAARASNCRQARAAAHPPAWRGPRPGPRRLPSWPWRPARTAPIT